MVVVSLYTGVVTRRATLGQEVTSLAWAAGALYMGGEGGRVGAVGEEGEERQVLALDSQVVQLATEGEVLVASTLTRVVVCHTGHKTFREVGSKLRQGPLGAALLGGRVWAARPGCRLWEVEVDSASVLFTRQFRAPITELPPAKLHGWPGPRPSYGGEHGFTLLRAQDGLLLTWSPSGRIYILDMEHSGILAWTSVSPSCIVEAVVEGSLVVVLDDQGLLHTLTFGPLAALVTRAAELLLARPWADLLLLNRSQVRRHLTSTHQLNKLLEVIGR